MLSEIMKKKLAKHFQFQDSNKDGFVEKSDWEQCAQNLAEIRGWASDSSEYKAILAKHIDIWKTSWLPADTDGDGKVSKEEYLELVEQLQSGDTLSVDQDAASQEEPEKKISHLDRLYDLFDAIFDIIDVDDDGEIGLDDYKQYFKAWGVDESLAQDSFASIDLNSDGILKRMAFVQFGTNFFVSNDENEFGNLIFGPLD